MARSPSSECDSPGLKWTELQQGQTRRIHSILGSQFGQIVLAAAFILNFLPVSRCTFQRAIPSPELGLACSHASKVLTLPVASAIQESAAP
jgi:hypothetical protein